METDVPLAVLVSFDSHCCTLFAVLNEQVKPRAETEYIVDERWSLPLMTKVFITTSLSM